MKSVEEKYLPGMSIVSKSLADIFFEDCVREVMAWDFPVVAIAREEAEQIVRKDLYYFSKQYGLTTHQRVISLFGAKE